MGRRQPADALNLAAARAGTAPGIHEFRVGLRRWRAWLKVVDLPPPPSLRATLSTALKRLGRAAGRVRDLDTLAAVINPPGARRRAAVPGAPGVVLELVRQQRSAALAALVHILDDGSTERLVEELSHLRGARVRPAALRPLARQVRRAAHRALRRPTPGRLHRLRRRAKMLRYALEAVAAEGSIEVQGHLRRLQTLLGRHHDAIAQRWWLRTHANGWAVPLADRLERRAHRALRRFPDRWSRLERPTRWWRFKRTIHSDA